MKTPKVRTVDGGIFHSPKDLNRMSNVRNDKRATIIYKKAIKMCKDFEEYLKGTSYLSINVLL
jgi:hypothetical protein